MTSTDQSAAIADGKVVSIAYVLTDPKGNELDRSTEESPLLYLHGARNIVPGLEGALTGKSSGDAVDVKVAPAQGYGERSKAKPQRILRSKFPADAKIDRGTRFMMEGPKGQPIPIWVTKVQGREVHVTNQHPLAGVTLCFAVKVLEVRDATDDERAHGHPHGPGGHHHEGDAGDADGEDASEEE